MMDLLKASQGEMSTKLAVDIVHILLWRTTDLIYARLTCAGLAL